MLTITNHPILKAHVFHINPKIKKTWVPASREPASVSFFLDNSTGLYSIFSVEKCKQIIKSVITATTTYSRTSYKFIQWCDSSNDVTFGLAFSCVTEIQSFIDSFDEAKLHAAKMLVAPTQNRDEAKIKENFFHKYDEAKLHAAKMLRPPQKSEDVSNSTTPELSNVEDKQQNVVPHNEDKQQNIQFESKFLLPHNEDKANILQPPSQNGNSASSNLMEELNKVLINDLTPENKKLILNLADYAANEKIFEAQLAMLKTNSARLKSALKERTAKAEEYKKQLLSRFDMGDCEKDSELRKEFQLLKLRVEQLEIKLGVRNSKADLLEYAVGEINKYENNQIVM